MEDHNARREQHNLTEIERRGRARIDADLRSERLAWKAVREAEMYPKPGESADELNLRAFKAYVARTPTKRLDGTFCDPGPAGA